MKDDRTLAAGYFDAVYAASDDPWSFETSAYEADEVPRPRSTPWATRTFERALEIGCSIGVFTALLAPRCAELLALDVSEAALAQAERALCGAAPGALRADAPCPTRFPPARSIWSRPARSRTTGHAPTWRRAPR